MTGKKIVNVLRRRSGDDAAAICPSIEADATQKHWIEGHGYIRGWLVFVLQEDSSRSAGRTNNVVTAISSLFLRQATENTYEIDAPSGERTGEHNIINPFSALPSTMMNKTRVLSFGFPVGKIHFHFHGL